MQRFLVPADRSLRRSLIDQTLRQPGVGLNGLGECSAVVERVAYLLQLADGFVQQSHFLEGDAEVVMCFRIFFRFGFTGSLFLQLSQDIVEDRSRLSILHIAVLARVPLRRDGCDGRDGRRRNRFGLSTGNKVDEVRLLQVENKIGKYVFSRFLLRTWNLRLRALGRPGRLRNIQNVIERRLRRCERRLFLRYRWGAGHRRSGSWRHGRRLRWGSNGTEGGSLGRRR